jgi:hypothetical protein
MIFLVEISLFSFRILSKDVFFWHPYPLFTYNSYDATSILNKTNTSLTISLETLWFLVLICTSFYFCQSRILSQKQMISHKTPLIIIILHLRILALYKSFLGHFFNKKTHDTEKNHIPKITAQRHRVLCNKQLESKLQTESQLQQLQCSFSWLQKQKCLDAKFYDCTPWFMLL